MKSHSPYHLAIMASRNPSSNALAAMDTVSLDTPLVLQCCCSSPHPGHNHWQHVHSPSPISVSSSPGSRSISNSPTSPTRLRSSASMSSVSSSASSLLHASLSGLSYSPRHSRSNSIASNSSNSLTSSSNHSTSSIAGNLVVAETPDVKAVAALDLLINGELRELLLLYADKTLSPFDDQGYWNCLMSHLTTPVAGDVNGQQRDVPLCDKRFVKSSRRSCRAHLWSCLTRHYPLLDAYDLTSFHQLCLKAHAHVLIRAFQVTTLFSRDPRPRRKIETLPSAEAWSCPLGCGQSYLLTNRASIRTHLDNGCCPLTPSQRSLPRRQSLMTRPSSFDSIASIHSLTSPRSAGRNQRALPSPELPSSSLYPVLDPSMISAQQLQAFSLLEPQMHHLPNPHFSQSMPIHFHDPSTSSSWSPGDSSYSSPSPSASSHSTFVPINSPTSPLHLNLSKSPLQEAFALSPPRANQNARLRHSQLQAGFELLGSNGGTLAHPAAPLNTFPYSLPAHQPLMTLATAAANEGEVGGECINDVAIAASLDQTITDRVKLDHIIRLLITQSHAPLSQPPLNSTIHQQTLRQLLAELSPAVRESLLHSLANPSPEVPSG